MKDMKNFHLTNIFFVFLIIVVQILTILPFFNRGFFPTHDDFSVQRVIEYNKSIKNGDFPARWSANLLNEYGYPLFIFYSPSVYMLGGTLVQLGIAPLLSVKLIFILGFIIGGLGIFLLAKDFMGYFPAIVSTLIFILAPYRATDVYVRGNIAEFLAFSLIPWIIFFNNKMIRNLEEKIWIYIHGIFLGILICTHHIATMIYFLFFIIFNIFHIFILPKKQRVKILLHLIYSSVLGALISSFYWFPLIIESKYVCTDELINFDLRIFFLKFKQLWHSKWGYGGVLEPNPMSLQLGRTLIICSASALIINFFIKTHKRLLIILWGFILIFFSFMETIYSAFIWKQFPILNLVRIPWRAHIITSIAGSLLSGFLFYLLESCKGLKKRFFNNFRTCLLGMVFIFTFILNYYYFKPRGYYVGYYPHETTTWNDEYLPKWVVKKPTGLPKEKIKFIDDKGILLNSEWGYIKKSFTIESTSDVFIEISHIYYPGWRAYVNNKEEKIILNDKTGEMRVRIPKGRINLVFIFKKTWWRILADLTTVMTFTFLAIQYLFVLLKRKKPIIIS